jgi:hypothetical protein
MKLLALLSFLTIGAGQAALAQSDPHMRDTVKVVVDNDKMRAVEYISTSGNGMCGEGMHAHEGHLTILLSDVRLDLVTPDGHASTFALPAGTTLWSDPETHQVIHRGEAPARVLLVYPK